ncbi:2-oxo-3-hexenedioate decarboxylase [Nocardioides daedukensis]|uniref:2-oxo-3-hexenedioate decarboxylase n=1 Tax=Nocardioides daedukensis TaxID=634462 RepID=A0A7Y9S0E9_9ACTN|nr:fumarylacetoacetate hydrolase family protein [Nocardioides daedukensis]NYG57200.1 2-oxo-3-hexenedioate decarboxylase [Nocardioides daedukensis]
MSLAPEDAHTILATARSTRTPVERFTDTHPDLDELWGYAAQLHDRSARIARGEKVIGAKLGLTSHAKQERMGVARPIVGFLTDAMVVSADEVAARLDEWAQPRIEPEIAFVTSRDISEPVGIDEIGQYVDSVLLAAEIIDSRFTGYRFRLADVLADNTSAAGVVLAPERHRLADVGDLAALGCTVAVDGEVVHEATGAAVLGQPLQALALLTEHVAAQSEVLPAGSLVLAGALTDATPMAAGTTYDLVIEGLGSLRVRA